MKVDSAGHLYVTGATGVWVFEPDGASLGVITTPEGPAELRLGRCRPADPLHHRQTSPIPGLARRCRAARRWSANPSRRAGFVISPCPVATVLSQGRVRKLVRGHARFAIRLLSPDARECAGLIAALARDATNAYGGDFDSTAFGRLVDPRASCCGGSRAILVNGPIARWPQLSPCAYASS
jgi:hypothetical protein